MCKVEFRRDQPCDKFGVESSLATASLRDRPLDRRQSEVELRV